MPAASPAAVVFDLDGVLVDTEPFWADAKREVSAEAGGGWDDGAPVAMLGMSGPEWSRYMHDELAVPLAPEEIRRRVVEAMLHRLRDGVALLPGVREAVESLAARWPLALASSADRPVIETVLEVTGLAAFFQVVVASDEAGRGKPAPDVYLAALEHLAIDPRRSAGIEDSPNGMRAVKAAGMALVAIPNAPGVDDTVLATADVVLDDAGELTPEVIELAVTRASAARSAGASGRPHADPTRP